VSQHSKFWVFLSIGLWRLSKHWKSVENDTENPRYTPHFRNSARHFRGSGLSTYRVKFRKRRFRRLEKILRFTGWRSTAHFYMGRKSELRFFRKVRNTFSVLGPILCFYSKIRPDDDDAYRLPIGPLLRRGQFSAFVQIPGCEMASKKKSERFCSTII
jgi:hypothetical protein